MELEAALRLLIKYLKESKQSTFGKMSSEMDISQNTIRNFMGNGKNREVVTTKGNVKRIEEYLKSTYFDYSSLDNEVKKEIEFSDLSYLIRARNFEEYGANKFQYDFIDDQFFGKYYLLRPGKTGNSIVVSSLELKNSNDRNQQGKFCIKNKKYDNSRIHRDDFSGYFYSKSGYIYLIASPKNNMLSSQLVMRQSYFRDGDLSGMGVTHCSQNTPMMCRFHAVKALDESGSNILDEKKIAVYYRNAENEFNKMFNSLIGEESYRIAQILTTKDIKLSKGFEEIDLKPIIIFENIAAIESYQTSENL